MEIFSECIFNTIVRVFLIGLSTLLSVHSISSTRLVSLLELLEAVELAHFVIVDQLEDVPRQISSLESTLISEDSPSIQDMHDLRHARSSVRTLLAAQDCDINEVLNLIQGS